MTYHIYSDFGPRYAEPLSAQAKWRLVDAKHHGGRVKTASNRLLGPNDDATLNKYFRNEELRSTEVARLLTLFRILHGQPFWLAAREPNRERLFTVKKKRRYYCSELPLSCVRKTLYFKLRRPEPLDDRVLALHPAFGDEVSPRRDQSQDNESVSANVDRMMRTWGRLGRCLLTAISTTGLNKWRKGLNDIDYPAKLKQFFTGREVVTGVAAGPLFHHLLNPDDWKILIGPLSKLGSGPDPICRPYGLITALVDEAGSSGLLFDARDPKNRLTFEEGVFRPGWEMSKGPYLALGTIGSSAEFPGEIVPLRCFAVSVLSSRCPLPADSNYERRIGQCLADFTERCPGLLLEKPVHPVIFEEEKAYPDYELTKFGLRFFVEVLGSDSPTYLSRKEKQSEIMRQHGAYHAVSAYKCRTETQWHRAQQELLEILTRWAVT